MRDLSRNFVSRCVSPVGASQTISSPGDTGIALSPSIAVPVGILYECSQHFTTGLQEWMTCHYLQEALQTLSPMLYHIVRKAVCEHLPGEWRDGDSGTLSFQDVPEILKVGVTAAHDRVAQFESGYVGSSMNLVGCVHVSRRGAMGLGILDFNL